MMYVQFMLILRAIYTKNTRNVETNLRIALSMRKRYAQILPANNANVVMYARNIVRKVPLT